MAAFGKKTLLTDREKKYPGPTRHDKKKSSFHLEKNLSRRIERWNHILSAQAPLGLSQIVLLLAKARSNEYLETFLFEVNNLQFHEINQYTAVCKHYRASHKFVTFRHQEQKICVLLLCTLAASHLLHFFYCSCLFACVRSPMCIEIVRLLSYFEKIAHMSVV